MDKIKVLIGKKQVEVPAQFVEDVGPVFDGSTREDRPKVLVPVEIEGYNHIQQADGSWERVPN